MYAAMQYRVEELREVAVVSRGRPVEIANRTVTKEYGQHGAHALDDSLDTGVVECRRETIG